MDSQREEAFSKVVEYWEKGTHEHTMQQASADCGCPAEYRELYRAFLGWDTDLHEDYQGSGYHHNRMGGLWYAIFDDD